MPIIGSESPLRNPVNVMAGGEGVEGVMLTGNKCTSRRQLCSDEISHRS